MTDIKVPITGKALQVCGKDSVSTEKIKEVLGIEEEDIKEAERLRLEKQEEELERQRSLALFNKREAKKALERLGVDPSSQKLMETLGVDENVIEEAKQENIERKEKQIIRTRKNSGHSDKKHVSKALGVLGLDPSLEKVKQRLGMKESDLKENLQRQAEEYEYKLETIRRRSRSLMDKKSTAKAQKILGVNKTDQKLIDILGIDINEFFAVRQELFESKENEIRRKRELKERQNKKQIQKALKVLGYDPSEKKLEETLGIEKERIRKEIQSLKSKENTSYPFYMKALFVGALVAALCIMRV